MGGAFTQPTDLDHRLPGSESAGRADPRARARLGGGVCAGAGLLTGAGPRVGRANIRDGGRGERRAYGAFLSVRPLSPPPGFAPPCRGLRAYSTLHSHDVTTLLPRCLLKEPRVWTTAARPLLAALIGSSRAPATSVLPPMWNASSARVQIPTGMGSLT